MRIRNARPVVIFDVLVRLMRRFSQSPYVRNITDIDDKINARAQSGRDIHEISEETAKVYHEDMAAVGALPPDVEPHATEHVTQMITMIENCRQGLRLRSRGSCPVQRASMADYGRLSKLDRREIVAGARVDVAPYKKDAQDVLEAIDLEAWMGSYRDAAGPVGIGAQPWLEHWATNLIFMAGASIWSFRIVNESLIKCALGADAFATYWNAIAE